MYLLTNYQRNANETYLYNKIIHKLMVTKKACTCNINKIKTLNWSN